MNALLNATYRKNIRREIKSTRSRFFSIFGIVMLGVAMLTGLLSVAPDMRAAGNRYFRASRLCDLRVVSTLGLTDKDVAAIAATEGVGDVMAVHTVECEAKNSAGDTLVMRAQSLPDDRSADNASYLNQLTVQQGRLPEKAGECAVQGLGFISGIALGDTVMLDAAQDGLNGTEFTVVGIVECPTNFSIDSETSSAGDGNLDFVAYMPQAAFSQEYNTVCYLTVPAAAELDTYSDAYADAVSAVESRLETLGGTRAVQRRSEIVGDAQAELDTAKQEYADKKADTEQKLADAQDELDAAQRKLDRSKAKLDQGEKAYEAGKNELAARRQSLPDTLSASASQIVVSEGSLLDLEAQADQLRSLQATIMAMEPTEEYALSAVQNAQTALQSTQPGSTEAAYYTQELASAQLLYGKTKGTIDACQSGLDAARQALYAQGLLTAADVSNQELLTQLQAKLKEMRLALLNGQLTISTAYGDLAKAEQQLADSRASLDDGWAQYNDGVAKLETATQEFADQKAEAEQKLADAEQKIRDAQAKIDDIAAGKWYVLDRDAITSYATFSENADRIGAIARVFPVFFFLVAALVALTTMTRMVEENRQQIGTLKALGYSQGAISAKYLLYALMASLSGAGAGILVGFAGFPSVIWYAYSIMYTVPGFRLRYDPRLIAVSLLVSVTVISAATLYACYETLREKPAALLLPKAPPAGRRILLEYITPLWRRMSFSHKVTARNLLRYKKRFFMTVLGVAGCTALLLVGFGLQDSIMDIVDDQFTRLNHYDLTVTLSDAKALTEENGLSTILDDSSDIRYSAAFYTKTVTIENADGTEGDVSLTVCEDDSALPQLFTLQTRVGHHPIAFAADSAVLTEKTAENLGLQTGDTFWLQAEDGTRVELTLTGVTENYIYSRLFLSRELYESRIGTLPGWNTVLAQSACAGDAAACSALSGRILAKNYVATASFIEETTGTFTNVISCINYVVLLVIFCAAALAAVVLYNLININIAERKKELATIKVLGFYEHEVDRYIFREIDILSFIGALAGLAIGVPLHQFIIRTVEIDQMMFIRSIAPSSYLYSVALTMLFTLGVSLLMRPAVRRISMVESMKAPE